MTTLKEDEVLFFDTVVTVEGDKIEMEAPVVVSDLYSGLTMDDIFGSDQEAPIEATRKKEVNAMDIALGLVDTTSDGDKLENMIARATKAGLKAEVIGTWIWVFNYSNLTMHGRTLLRQSFKYSKEKKAYYWHAGKYTRKSKYDGHLGAMRCKYGSIKINEED